jgi:hypothetical protein
MVTLNPGYPASAAFEAGNPLAFPARLLDFPPEATHRLRDLATHFCH